MRGVSEDALVGDAAGFGSARRPAVERQAHPPKAPMAQREPE